jgi:aspartate/methionine/tyrosine aminotransferase
MDPLSDRGRRLVDHAPMPEYIDAHFERLDDGYDPDANPNGYIGLAIAENKLVWPLLESRLHAPRAVSPESVAYDEMIGSAAFRSNLASFLGQELARRPIDPAHIAVLAGSGSVLETLFYVIADAGDAVLVPTPSYAGFWADLETRDALTIVPVHTSASDHFTLTTELLDEALARSVRPVKALLYTNPSNPLGTVASSDEVRAVVRWARDRDVHLVVDEVFALSAFGERPFTSASSFGPLGPTTHVVWAFSKDFGMSGVRCGVLVTENEDVMAAVDALAYWSAVSGDTQFLLDEMLADRAWTTAYLAGMRDILRTAYRRVAEHLDRHGIPHHPAEAGVFVVLDLRDWLDEPTWDAEERLWRRLVDEANVNLTPGSACRNGEPGFLRLVYATAPTDHVETAVDRIAAVLSSSGQPLPSG